MDSLVTVIIEVLGQHVNDFMEDTEIASELLSPRKKDQNS